jgi:hypothetical protein
MATKKPTKTEIMDIPEDAIIKVDTSPINVVSVPLDISDEALMPEPVPAVAHVAMQDSQLMTFPRPAFEKLLPVVATVFASITLGALLITVGIMLGAGL